MTGDFLEGVRDWVDRSGHTFELRVARSMRLHGARQVDLSFTYTDVNSGVVREGDVIAHFPWTARNQTPASVEVVAECKSGNMSWVAFFDRRTRPSPRLADWAYYDHGPFIAVTGPLAELRIATPPFDAWRLASHVVTAHKDAKSNNPAGDAIRKVLSTAAGRKQRYLDTHRDRPRGIVILPVVVTGGRIVEAELDDAGDVKLSETNSVLVRGARDGNSSAPVWVLTEEAVEPFARSMAHLVERAHEEARFASS